MTCWMLCLHGNWSFYSNFIDSCYNKNGENLAHIAQVFSYLNSLTPTFNRNKTNIERDAQYV